MTTIPLPHVFARFKPLSTAEQQIGVGCNDKIILNTERPTAETSDNTVRANFLATLLQLPRANSPIPTTGFYLQGAWINGTLDLNSLKLEHNLRCIKCVFSETLILFDARVDGNLNLQGSQCKKGIAADGLKVTGNFFLRNNFAAHGEIRLLGATLGGNFDCCTAHFENPEGHTLFADGAHIGGDVFLSDEFQSHGGIRLLGATLGGNLDCRTARLENPKSEALYAEGIDIRGHALLRNGHFQGKFNFNHSHIHLGLDLRELSQPPDAIDLRHAQVGTLADDTNSWPSQKIFLDGLRYERLESSLTAKQRIQWLRTQTTPHSTRSPSFIPQPWQHVIRTLRHRGDRRMADEIAIAYERQRRQHGQVYAQWLHRLFDVLMRFGYRPLRLLKFSGVVYLLGCLILWLGANQGVFMPSQTAAMRDIQELACERNWTQCTALQRHYPSFKPLLHTLDLIFPVANLRQAGHWVVRTEAPPAASTSYPYWAWMVEGMSILLVAYGWLSGFLFVGVLSGLIKRD